MHQKIFTKHKYGTGVFKGTYLSYEQIRLTYSIVILRSLAYVQNHVQTEKVEHGSLVSS